MTQSLVEGIDSTQARVGEGCDLPNPSAEN